MDIPSGTVPLDTLPPVLQSATLHSLLDDTARGVAILDLAGRFRYANPLFCEGYRIAPGAYIGVPVRDAAPDLWSQLGPVLDEVCEGHTVTFESAVSSSSGPQPSLPCGVRRMWEVRWRPVRDEDGPVLAILGVTQDVTERYEQQRLAELRGLLIETASHELRGPLASVLGFAHRLTRSEVLPAHEAEEAQLIREQAEEMAFRLNLFLGASQLDEAESDHGAHTSYEEVRVDDLLEREAEALRARLPHVHVEVSCPDGVTVTSDSHLIRQIVANLLENAARYGSGWVGLAAERDDRGLLIRVEDDGEGISPEDQSRVFARGYRAEAARQRRADGQGLGLFIAREFAERLGGRLSLRSEVGAGTTFELRLPSPASQGPRAVA